MADTPADPPPDSPANTDLTPGMQLLDRLDDNKLAPNIMHFGRVLRAAGLPIGPGKIIDATQAVSMNCSTRHSTYSGKTPSSWNG